MKSCKDGGLDWCYLFSCTVHCIYCLEQATALSSRWAPIMAHGRSLPPLVAEIRFDSGRNNSDESWMAWLTCVIDVWENESISNKFWLLIVHHYCRPGVYLINKAHLHLERAPYQRQLVASLYGYGRMGPSCEKGEKGHTTTLKRESSRVEFTDRQ